MSEALSEVEAAAMVAKYGPVLCGELQVDLESGEITGDGPLLAFWSGLVDSFRARVAVLEAENRDLQAMRAKWEFEHELAMDQETETQRLDEEISVLQEQTKASRESVAQFCRMLDVDTDVEAWDELASLLRLVDFMPEAKPAYVVPPADPLLAKPEKHR